MIIIAALDTKKAIELLLFNLYQSEFEVIDRLNQHPKGINFYQWLFQNGIIKESENNRIQAQIKLEDDGE